MRSARRLAAGLAVVAAVVPLAGLPTVSPAWAAPVRAATSTLEGECDPDNPKLVNQKPAALLQLGAAEAQTVATGAGITVAVVDSGVDSRNIHLTGGAVATGVDYVTPGGNGETDTYGHGTAVAGLIAARAVQGSGVVGLAPNVTILPIRVYSQDGDNAQQPGERPPSVAGIAVGIQAAANLGARIINVSLSTTDNDPGLESAVRYATDRGALVVASAGNRTTSEDKSNSPRYPGAYGDVLSVAAVDGTGNVTDDSIHGSYVDVAAPGTDVLTTYLNAGDCQLATDNASTSYATAFVSAAAAMIAQAHPTETPAQWRFRLESTALRLRPDARDDNAGWGVIQPYEALTLVSDGTAPGPQDPAVTDPPSATPVAADLPLGSVQEPDHTTRDQTLWLGLGGVVAVLGLALVALLRRDRRREPAATRPPAGVR